MIYVLLFWEFFKIGLTAVGGGMVTIPFLLDLSGKYDWYSRGELLDMIAISESTPGPIGVNMATYVGYNTAGIAGGAIATMGLVLPSLLVIILIAKYLFYAEKGCFLRTALFGIRPAVLALILFAGWELARLSVSDWQTLAIAVVSFGLIRWLKWHPVAYIFWPRLSELYLSFNFVFFVIMVFFC